ncbi:MAG: response regulator [Candidatus Helarchaeota archaeon]|nr:response regulator [Candidatus Helarchaeota archaeon]
MKILIVDDDRVFLETMRNILILDNHTITTAVSAEEALVKLDEDKFNLILTDLKMPGLSGVDLIRKIRENRIDSIIIVITGYGTIESAVEAMKQGAYDYILKPFEAKTIRNKISQVELDLKLRKSLPLSSFAEKPVISKKLESIDTDKNKGPFLVISDQNPNEIIKRFNLSNGFPIWLKRQNGKSDTISISFYSLKTNIKDFVENHDKGTIIFQGIEEFLKIYEWEELKKFISYLLSEIITANFSLVLLIREEVDFLTSSQQTLLKNILSLFIDPIISKIINLLSHPLRKSIITLLKSEKKLNFNKIVKMLEVKSSANLAFHINKLVQENILKKEKNLYELSPVGLYFVDIISQLESIGFSYPHSQIKVFKISENSQN